MNGTLHEWTTGGSLIWSSPIAQGRTPADMTAGFHWYETVWDTGIVSWLVDGTVFGQYTHAMATAAGYSWDFDGATMALRCGLGATTAGVFGPSINAATELALPLSIILKTVEVWT